MKDQHNWALINREDGRCYPFLFDTRSQAREKWTLFTEPKLWRVARVSVREVKRLK